MRLSATQQQCILQATRKNFGPDTKVWLFGSRADNARRGGDIDLYVETNLLNTFMPTLRCKIAIEEGLDLHVDLIVSDRSKNKPIYQIAKNRGIQL